MIFYNKNQNQGKIKESNSSSIGGCYMENCLERDKIASPIGIAIQDDETFKSEGGFISERDQYYFQMQEGENVFLVGSKELLICLRLLEKMGEFPEIGEKWWLQMATLYGNDILLYHNKNIDYIREYVDETGEPQRRELYRIAKEHFDKAIYLLQEETGIYITHAMAEALAVNYASMRVYNYIGATVYNIPWYLIYSFNGFSLYHMIIRKNTIVYKHLLQNGFILNDSEIKGHVYIADNKGCLLTATNYRYVVDKNDNLNEWLDFSILCPDNKVTDTLLYVAMDRFSIKVDSYYFGNLINYSDWNPRQKVLHIAERYMNP